MYLPKSDSFYCVHPHVRRKIIAVWQCVYLLKIGYIFAGVKWTLRIPREFGFVYNNPSVAARKG